MPQDDMTNESERWMPEEGRHNLEIISMEGGYSRAGNPKYTIVFASADNPKLTLQQDITNIQGKRWLLRQMIEACGIEPEENEEGKKIYNWEIEDMIGKTVSAQIIHDKTPFIGRDGREIVIPKAKIIRFEKMSV